MMKLHFKLALLSAIALAAATTADAASKPKPAPAAAKPAGLKGGEGAVNIVAWAGYIERGESDKAYDWVTGFEKNTGCKVSVKVASSSDEMVALMNQGGFDLVTASGDASLRLVAGKTVQAIDTKRIPSWGTVDKRLQGAAWHTVKGVHYGVPYQWGPNVLMYSTKVFKTAPTSWGVVFEAQNLPDGKANKGRIQGFYGPIYIADAAVYLMKKNPALGIKDPYALTQKQYDAVLNVLRGQNKIVQRYWDDANKQIDDFKTEGVVAAPSWPFQVNTLIGQKQAVASAFPAEGATGWADTTMLHAKAKHPKCAYAWLEHSLNPVVQGDVAAWFGSVPAVPDACTKSKLLGADGCKTNGIDNFDKIWFWRTPVADCGGKEKCVPYTKWVSDFTAIKGGR
jgi:putative spermidine/putrescine transport system substrate-binding protein